MNNNQPNSIHDTSSAYAVSVCMVSYNHAAFIGKAIESVMKQQTDFPVNLVIGEDCSTDSTRAVIEEYQQHYPNRIQLIISSANVGAQANFIRTFNSCTGEYIAILEGDDYWTDVDKLQIQVAALRDNPDCVLCAHDAETFYDVNAAVAWTFGDKFARILPALGETPRKYTQLDLARFRWFLPTASLLYRASSLPRPLPEWVGKVFGGDFTLQLLSTRWGSVLYLPRVMSRYRLHEHSITNSTLRQPEYRFERSIYEGKMFQKYVFEPQHRKHANIYLSTQYQAYARYLGSTGQRWQQLQYLAKASFYGRQHLPLFIMRRLGQLFTPSNHN